MKPNILLMLLAISGLSITACQKEDSPSVGEIYYDATEIIYLSNGIEDAEDEEVGAFYNATELETRSRCVDVQAAQPKGTFPNTITLSFEGCTNPAGHSIDGQIIITVTGPMHVPGSVKTSTFVDFFIDGVQVSGNKMVTVAAIDTEGNVTLERSSDLEFIFEDKILRSWTAEHTLVQLSGGDTRFRMDDAWSITGSAEGTNARKGEFAIQILEALIKKGDCPWIVSGVKEITASGQTFLINFGDGSCDNKAILTLPDGETREIVLGRRR